MNIIIFGEMGSGKSTVANYLRDTYGYSKFAFGSKIHSECRMHGSETRTEMQLYGQSMRKIFGINIWCDYVYNQSLGCNKIVIEDGRQLNEYDYYVKLGYLPVGVVTEDSKRIVRLKKRVDYLVDPNTFNHETEMQARVCINKCKIKIYNNSDDQKDLIKEIEDKLGKYLRGGI
jgi:hypothetical protein